MMGYVRGWRRYFVDFTASAELLRCGRRKAGCCLDGRRGSSEIYFVAECEGLREEIGEDAGSQDDP